MLLEQAIRETSKRRVWVIFPVMTCAILAVMLYFVGVGNYREFLTSFAIDRFGETAGDLLPIVLILLALLLFLVPTLAAAAYADRFKTICPSCDKDITNHFQQVLATRCCPSCEQNIVHGGRIRSAAVYKRYLAVRSRTFLKYWFWAWPTIGSICIAWWLFDRSAFQRCPQCFWMAPLIGTTAAGWAWVRTFDHRYLPPLLASMILLVIGAMIFWQAL